MQTVQDAVAVVSNESIKSNVASPRGDFTEYRKGGDRLKWRDWGRIKGPSLAPAMAQVTDSQFGRIESLASTWYSAMSRGDLAMSLKCEAKLHAVLKADHCGQGFILWQAFAFWVDRATPDGKVNRFEGFGN